VGNSKWFANIGFSNELLVESHFRIRHLDLAVGPRSVLEQGEHPHDADGTVVHDGGVLELPCWKSVEFEEMSEFRPRCEGGSKETTIS